MSMERAYLGFALETAGDGSDERTIRGVANTGRVMRSGRMLHPGFFEGWLARSSGEVPLMAQHGQVDGFATVGRAQLTYAGGKLRFAAQLAEGTPLAAEALALVRQGMLRTVSIGWNSTQARVVTSEDADLDPVVAKALKQAGRQSAYVFFAGEIVELSLVDVPDDAGALIGAAALPAAANAGASTLLRSESNAGEIATAVAEQLGAELARAAAAACEAHFEGLYSRFEARLLETIEEMTANLNGDYAAGLLGPDLAECDHDRADPDSAPQAGGGRRPTPQHAAEEAAAIGSRIGAALERVRRK